MGRRDHGSHLLVQPYHKCQSALSLDRSILVTPSPAANSMATTYFLLRSCDTAQCKWNQTQLNALWCDVKVRDRCAPFSTSRKHIAMSMPTKMPRKSAHACRVPRRTGCSLHRVQTYAYIKARLLPVESSTEHLLDMMCDQSASSSHGTLQSSNGSNDRYTSSRTEALLCSHDSFREDGTVQLTALSSLDQKSLLSCQVAQRRFLCSTSRPSTQTHVTAARGSLDQTSTQVGTYVCTKLLRQAGSAEGVCPRGNARGVHCSGAIAVSPVEVAQTLEAQLSADRRRSDQLLLQSDKKVTSVDGRL